MSVSEWSATADENTTVDGINIAEHCPAKNMNDALRAVMAAVKNECDALQSDLGTCLRIGGGRLTGPLTLDGGEAAEGVDSSGNTWIRYKSGLQICWGRVKVNGTITETNTKVTFPVAFKLTPAVLTTGNAHYLGYNVMVGWETATSFTIGTVSEAPVVGETNWIAIGCWK